jgi:hypothetical protein
MTRKEVALSVISLIEGRLKKIKNEKKVEDMEHGFYEVSMLTSSILDAIIEDVTEQKQNTNFN